MESTVIRRKSIWIQYNIKFNDESLITVHLNDRDLVYPKDFILDKLDN